MAKLTVPLVREQVLDHKAKAEELPQEEIKEQAADAVAGGKKDVEVEFMPSAKGADVQVKEYKLRTLEEIDKKLERFSRNSWKNIKKR